MPAPAAATPAPKTKPPKKAKARAAPPPPEPDSADEEDSADETEGKEGEGKPAGRKDADYIGVPELPDGTFKHRWGEDDPTAPEKSHFKLGAWTKAEDAKVRGYSRTQVDNCVCLISALSARSSWRTSTSTAMSTNSARLSAR